MIDIKEITSPVKLDLVIAFSDLTFFSRLTHSKTMDELFQFLFDYYEFVGEIIENSGGTVIKFIGDAVLISYPGELADNAVLGLRELINMGDSWLNDKGMNTRHIIKAHYGPVICGLVGTKGNKRVDIFGETVNGAALLKSNGFAIAPQLFRKLSSDVRKLFKKHTPPISYIPIEERHKD